MKSAFKVLTVIVVFLSAPNKLTGTPQQPCTLSEQDLVKFFKLGGTNDGATDLVKRCGVTFELNEDTVLRLKKAGAQDSLLETIRKLGAPVTPKRPNPPPPTDTSAMLQAVRHVKLGQLKAQDKDYEGALREFADAEKASPQWGEIFYQRGLILAALERFTEAAAEWKKYLSAAGSEADVKTVQDKIVEWEYRAEKTQKLNALVEKGRQQLEAVDLEGAIASFQGAVKMSPSLSNLLNLGHAYWLKGEYQSLPQITGPALELDQNSLQALLYQAAIEVLVQHAPDKSTVTVQRALNLDPNQGLGHALLYESLRLKGNFKAAQAECERALVLDPNLGLAQNRLGWIVWHHGDYRNALEQIRKATQTEPKNADWHSDLSYALSFRGDSDGALTEAKEAVHLNPKSAAAHDAMGLALEAKGSMDQAIQEYNEAIKVDPVSHPEFLQHLNKAVRKRRGSAR